MSPRPSSVGRGWLSRHWFKLVTSLAIGAGFVWLLHAGALPIIPGRDAFARMRWWTIPAYVVLWSVVHWLRAARWYWLLEPIHRVPLKRVVNVAFIGFLAIVVLPFRTGEMVRPILVRKKGQLYGWGNATVTIGSPSIPVNGRSNSWFPTTTAAIRRPTTARACRKAMSAASRWYAM